MPVTVRRTCDECGEQLVLCLADDNAFCPGYHYEYVCRVTGKPVRFTASDDILVHTSEVLPVCPASSTAVRNVASGF
jgi:hypothetical protein